MGASLTTTGNFVIQIGKLYYPIRGNKFTYANILGLTGVTEPTDTTVIQPRVRMGEFIRSGQVFVLNARTEDGKTHSVYCAAEKIAGSGAIIGKQINSSKITTAGGRVRRYIK